LCWPGCQTGQSGMHNQLIGKQGKGQTIAAP
jgi:hypothetical protein